MLRCLDDQVSSPGTDPSLLFWYQPKLLGLLLPFVTKSRVQLLTVKKPWKSNVGGRESLLYLDGGRESLLYLDVGNVRGGQQCLSKGWPPSSAPDSQCTRAFLGWGWGLQAERVQSALIVILKSVISSLTSITLIVLSTVNLKFQGKFVPIFSRPFLKIVAAYIMATVWSSFS